MYYLNSKIRYIVLSLGFFLVVLVSPNAICANKIAETETAEEKRVKDSLANKILDEVFISRYLRFFDGTYKAPENKVLYQERPELEGDIPYYPNSDSVYKARLEKLNENFVVKLPYNEKVKNYIDVYINKKRKQVNVMLALSQYYFPIFEDAMEREGVPTELKYLAVIESALNPRAVSPVGASGIWQFMYPTGRMFDLKINSTVDERLDPNKASTAAAMYLKDLHRCFGDWTLAIAAYNCGPGNVNKAIRKAKGKTDFWDIYPFLPRETRGYVPAFIGATYVMNYYKEHGFYPPIEEMPILTDTVIMSQDIDMRQVAESLEIPLQVLRDLNPQYKKDIIPGKTDYFSLRLPVNFVGEFLEYQEAIYDSTASNISYITEDVTISHRIRRGETLSAISQRYGVKVKDLISWNNLKSSLIYPNQILQIITKKRLAPKLAEKPTPKVETTQNENTESVSIITTTSSRNYVAKTDSSGINDSNNNTTSSSNIGSNSQTSATTNSNTNSNSSINSSTNSSIKTDNKIDVAKSKIVKYTIKRGETLYSISKKHPGSNIKEIVSRNNLPKNGSLIYPNQVLTIEMH